MTIQEILEAHQQVPGHYDCRCGWEREAFTGYISHRAHVAEVLDKHMQEREQKSLAAHRREWADYIENWHSTVGAPICHVDTVIQALRSNHLPFGKAATNGR
ncbi:hypothetical protein CQ010_01320 [Arthrobacter sp. MYb211]|nr:hypothetical protein CQ015_03575 [Arthrobacter sp. MYb221]PRC10511.1 hypothetical protein CQ010_01320 [Arthrobacter sp. MYb211]